MSQESNIILYTTLNGQVNVQVQYDDGSLGLPQKCMAELLGVESHTINYHLKNPSKQLTAKAE